MSSFFERNQLPMVAILRNWTDHRNFTADMRSGAAVRDVTTWPIFIKFCHLTQGSARSVRRAARPCRPLLPLPPHGLSTSSTHQPPPHPPLPPAQRPTPHRPLRQVRAVPSAKWLADNIEELEGWVSEKWTMKANDWTRPWHESSNALTDVAPPGVFLQAPARSSQNLRTGKSYFIETKVEVLWGKAYLAILYPEGLDHVEPLVTRPNGTWHAEVFDGYPAVLAAISVPMATDAWYQWIFTEGHMDCAWRLAERTATLMGADQVRLDIFLARNHPGECSLNENSISSGHPYGAHGEHLANIWCAPPPSPPPTGTLTTTPSPSPPHHHPTIAPHHHPLPSRTLAAIRTRIRNSWQVRAARQEVVQAVRQPLAHLRADRRQPAEGRRRARRQARRDDREPRRRSYRQTRSWVKSAGNQHPRQGPPRHRLGQAELPQERRGRGRRGHRRHHHGHAQQH